MNLYVVIFLFLVSGCAIHKPCSEAGDVTWNPKIIGDKRCKQKSLPDGRVVNHGSFQQSYQSNGEIALDGNFVDGKKDGIWLFYGEDRHLISAKFFEKGVEKTPDPESQKKIDLIIQQKAGVK